ncbi:MAG TPA: crosslink repair DNA glycosylase YcaQ family protein [Bryobacteraceae bacterium]|nr:crosslink repair DNA glycosylase YcaQ family protein [Bryobacteraceae bacterium]
MDGEELSLSEARRIALVAQGFDRSRPPHGRVGARDIARTIRQLGLVQIDYVNVLTPAHYLAPFSRLGPYDRKLLDGVVYGRRGFTEQWAHEASIVPVESWPLLRHRMENHRVRPWGFETFLERNPDYVEWVLGEVRERGPLSADDLPEREGVSRRLEGTWIGTVPRAVLEALFGRGVLAVAGRRPNFARVFDMAERVVPVEHLDRRVSREEAQRELLRMAARSCGVGTAADLADYYRMPIREVRPRIEELVETGELCEVRVEGWPETAYLDAGARAPGQVDAAALVAPFDPVVWHRPRAERLFGFQYRVEIFVPEEKRRWGYYVLPFLLGDGLVARVDVKADRSGRRLVVPAAYAERGVNRGEVARALASELRTMAEWLRLEAVAVGRRGDLARELQAAVK